MQIRDLLHRSVGVNAVYMRRDDVYLGFHAPIAGLVELLEVVGIGESGRRRDKLCVFGFGQDLRHRRAGVLGRGELCVIHVGVVGFVVNFHVRRWGSGLEEVDSFRDFRGVYDHWKLACLHGHGQGPGVVVAAAIKRREAEGDCRDCSVRLQ